MSQLFWFSSESRLSLSLVHRVLSLGSLQPLLVLLFQPVMSDHGLLTTVAYKLGRDKPACYALEVPRPSCFYFPACDLLKRAAQVHGEWMLAKRADGVSLQGSVAIAGAVVRWLQDNLGIISSSEELGTLPWQHVWWNVYFLLYHVWT